HRAPDHIFGTALFGSAGDPDTLALCRNPAIFEISFIFKWLNKFRDENGNDGGRSRTSVVRCSRVNAPESGSAAGAVLGRGAADVRLAQPDRPRPAPFNYRKRNAYAA